MFALASGADSLLLWYGRPCVMRSCSKVASFRLPSDFILAVHLTRHFAFALGALSSVPLTVVRQTPLSWIFNRYPLRPRAGRSCPGAASVLRHVSSSWRVIKVGYTQCGHHWRFSGVTFGHFGFPVAPPFQQLVKL